MQLVLILLLPFALACGQGGSEPTPVPATTATVPATLSPTASPEPTATPAVHPAGTRTGVSEVDEFLEIHEAGDSAAMADLLIYRDFPCLPPETAEYQVACPEGVDEGTPVSAFLVSACHGGWVGESGREQLADELLERDFRVHSVVRVQGHFAIADGNDSHDIVLVTASTSEQSGIVYRFAEGGGLVYIANGCWLPVADVVSQYGYDNGDILFAAP